MKRSDEKGVSAVEFALILPVLVLIIFGIIEFGLILYNKQVITNASREAARTGILFSDPRKTLGDIQNVVTSYTSNRMITFSNASVTPLVALPNGTCVSYGNPAAGLQVDVTYPYTFLVLDSFGLSGPELKSSTTMRCE